ncbi:hypothetical protein GHT06_018006 [Daphnia sinensis]|uniref:Tudor domain-containing protein 1 n=1 Tax=Daphnia sinensis TaxID=1820382 RepID=A0AAD5L3R7_9CRUS|nr:hypothetical protein GHT06_018006 [Daphnia sinensis]
MRRVPQRAPKRIPDRSHMEWQEFDPRVEEYYNTNNHYTSGPGLHLPPSLPYTMRTNAVPYKLFVSGIHPHTTEEGIKYIFCNYGKPLSVIRTRNKLQQPIAFVEFASQCEADNAIIELDGKPPLNWEVCYAMTRCSEERVYPQFANLSLESDFERQTPMFQTSGIGRQPLQSRLPVFTDKESSMELTQATITIPNFPKQEIPTCFVCGTQAPLVCTICKTRYCSQACQGSDWPTHQHICRPPPALEPVSQHVHAGDRASQLRLACGKSVAAKNRDYTNISSSHQKSDGPVTVEQTRSLSADVGQNYRPGSAESASSHSYIIKGIKPLDQMGSSNQRAADLSVTIHRNINSGSRTKTPDVRIVKDVNDGPVKYGKNQIGTRDMQVTEQNKPTQGFTPSPNLTNNYDTSKNSNKSSTVSPKQNQTTLNERQYENHLDMGAGPKSRNFPMVDVSPNTHVGSANQKPQQLHTTSATKIYAQEFSPGRLELVSDKPSKVLVCFAKSPSELYIQYFTFREILQQLMASIDKSATASDPLVNPTEGLPCLAIYPADNCWYRAQVMKVLPDGIGVRYVDYGNTTKMPNTKDNIRKMEHWLSQYPFYATKVKLADVFPVNGSSWDKDVCLRFREIVNDQTFLMECVDRDADAMSVRLKNSDGSDLVTRLLQESLVRKTPLKASDERVRLPIATGTTALPRSQQAVHNLQTSNSQLPGFRSGSSTAPSPVYRSPQAQERVQAVTPKELTGTSLTISEPSPLPAHSPTRAALRQDASFSQPRAPTMPSAPIRPISLPSRPLPSAHSPLPPKANSIIEVLEAGMTVIFQMVVRMSCDRFVGMLIRGEDDMGIIEFNSLAETIESVPNFRPTVGSVVAARSLVDNQWYRGCITKVLKSSYTVLYVDYGNVEEGVISVKPIPSSYRHLMLCVSLSVAENSSLGINKYMDETMVLDSSHQLEVTAKTAKDSVLAKIIAEDIPTCVVQLEPWTSLLSKLDDAPIPIRDIASPNWEIGFSCEVMPFVAEDVDCIYVQAVTDETVALTCKIQEELKEYLPTSKAVSTIPVVGSCVAAIFPDDGELYRARIVETMGNSVTLFYVDFGNSATVSLSEIRVLPDRFYDYPACCKRVSLADVVRPASPLPTAVKDLLSSCVNTICKMVVLPSTSPFTECALTQDGKVLNQLIIDIFEQSTTRTETSPPSHMPKLEAASPERDRTQERDAPVDNTLSEMSYDDGPFMELPEESPFQAVISNVEGPQLIMLRVLDDQMSTKLVRLGEELEAYATAIVRGYGPKMNEICIARYPDGKWYRSACLDEIADPAGKRYMCIQVDYGETHIVDVDDIRRIPKRLIDYLPYQAQHTILEGTESMEEVKTELSTRLGELLPNNSQVTVSVVSRIEMAYVVRIPQISAILSSEGLL